MTRHFPTVVSTILLIGMLLAPSVDADPIVPLPLPDGWSWIPAIDKSRVTATGTWQVDQFRFADAAHLKSYTSGDTLKIPFSGTAAGLRLAGQNTPEYQGQGAACTGKIQYLIDGTVAGTIACTTAGREHLLVQGLKPGKHLLELRHLGDANGIGCRIEGCFAFTATPGTVQGYVTGQRSQFLTDCRITLLQNTQEIRSAISRNWLAGTYSLLAPAGDNYQLRITAAGWTTFTSEAFSITRDSNTVLPHTFLNRTPDTTAYRFRFPQLNQQAIQKAGDTFAARFLGFSATIEYVRITRRIGEHVISRNLDFQEQKEHAHYYDRQVLATLPGDTPPGIYDLEISIHGDQRTSICRSPRAVAVVKDHPHDPVLVTWGHLDTSGQFQAEYLQRLCAMTNLIAPDMVLSSNCVNPAYIAGAMSTLRSPYVVNFGNHQVPGHSHWYGSTVQIVPLTPKINVLNYGQPWFHGTEQAQGLLQKHPHAEFNLINGFESNAPVEFLNTNKVRLIHDAHGVGSKAMIIPGTRTQRVGKVNSISFRVVRFKDGFVESCTYDNHPTAAIPFDRHQQPPLRVDYDLQQTGHVASIVNELKMDFSQAKVRFLVPAGHVYQSSAGEIQTAALSDDKRILEVVVGVDIPRESAITVTLSPRN